MIEMPPKPGAVVIPMKPHRLSALSLLKRFCQSIGLASIILVMNYGDLLGGGADVRMHVPYRLTGIAMAQLADIFLLGLLLFAVLVPLQRTRSYPWVRLVVAILMPPYILWRMQALLPLIMFDGLVPLFATVWAALLLFLMLRNRRVYNYVIRFGDAVGVFLSVFAFFSMMQLLYITRWQPAPHEHTAAWATTPQPPRDHPVIVWIIFDELSFDQLFDHRAHNLALPNFDKLRAESTLFTNVQPIGYKTVKIIPSLLLGKNIDDFRYHFDNSFTVHYTGEHGFHPVRGANTIFHDAQAAGYRTAVVGWYNPYCTIYGDAIDNCYWQNYDRIDGLMSQRDGFWRNTYSPLQQVVREMKAPARADRDACNYDVRQRLATHLDLEKHWTELLHGDQADFVYMHLSIPHSPNIWSAITNDYTTYCGSSYLDSLALVDREVGKVLDDLQTSPRWKDTTLIVQGDHGWRIPLWDWLPAWTDADETATGDRGFDPRPAVIIHQPGQTQPATNATAWSLLNIHSVLEQSLRGGTVTF